MEHLHKISLAIGFFGIAVIVWGVLLCIIKLVSLEVRRFMGANDPVARENLRHHLAYYLMLGLELLVAADIVNTIMEPKLEELYVLGGIVLIRTAISVSINWELAQSTKMMHHDKS